MSYERLEKKQKPNPFNAVVSHSKPRHREFPYRAPSPLIRHTNNAGIPEPVKTQMEHALQTDLSGVTIHSSSSKAVELGALAYTQGNKIHFAPGMYNPQSGRGREILKHEIAHVKQQRDGRVPATTQKAGLNINTNKGLEREADIMSRKAIGPVNNNEYGSIAPEPAAQPSQAVQCIRSESNIKFDDNATLIAEGASKPENKCQVLNNLYQMGAITDQSLDSRYQNGHMVAAMFGGQNKGENIRVWSDRYEDKHTEFENWVRYGNDQDPSSKPKSNEKGTVLVETTDQTDKYQKLVDELISVSENPLYRRGYWDRANLTIKTKKDPDENKWEEIQGPKTTIINKALKGDKLDIAVNAIPTQVRFQYTESADGGRQIEMTTSDGLGNPGASSNVEAIIEALSKYAKAIDPTGKGKPHERSPEGKKIKELREEAERKGKCKVM